MSTVPYGCNLFHRRNFKVIMPSVDALARVDRLLIAGK